MKYINELLALVSRYWLWVLSIACWVTLWKDPTNGIEGSIDALVLVVATGFVAINETINKKD